jgi:hypothetical protein
VATVAEAGASPLCAGARRAYAFKAVAGPARDIVRMTATGRVRSADGSSEGKKAHLQLRVYQQHGRLAITHFEGDASCLLSLLLLLLP